MTAFAIIVIILMAGAARFYVRKKYGKHLTEQREAMQAALNRNREARVRNIHVANR